MKKWFFYDMDIGNIGIGCKDTGITDALLPGGLPDDTGTVAETQLHREAFRQLKEYFAGTRREFSLPLSPEGTEFQKRVWKCLLSIPYGETRSYKQIAEMAGCPRGYRAVGMANNRNPIPIFIPCHRVIGANGSLVGYGGGLDIKKKLLRLEQGR
ncbi:methylated-DNA--[protein]-cysteine S-methyltransferase [Caproiciproducens galactitolivorans]|uniref:Methylated-DNA--protein-cysteine methyltransferase n=1 Tax=Caproiciproducens galactitolivorans TaxID=642589 RepID=A0A4Z0YAW0_9FIRM|nr:methylated-DNA--[protein]-cysteine S-methyltransferase [Caproiciproducens galactitolivorans]QEY34806.1 methylated-DNA--[protein]-cysteine S-methyltransferase [Caproiciproducens galactitolivorans]TGJ75943.1 methylated-DNA--protein-cysteine methyltransferase [Caproiciproducens galactitolivorans]